MKNSLVSKLSRLFIVPVLALSVFVACSDDNSVSSDVNPTIVDLAAGNANFTTLVELLQQAGLDGALSEGEFTVFAPTNAAFENLPDGLLASLTEEQVSTILQYHVIAASVPSAQLQPQQAVASLTGEELFITVADGSVTVNGNSTVTTPDVVGSNGIIHAVDEVLIPNEFLNVVEIAQKNYNLTSLVDAVLAADLAGVLSGDGPFTVFAPTNTAFAEIADVAAGLTVSQLSQVLTFHVLPVKVASTDLQPTQTVGTVNGQEVTVTLTDGGAFINGETAITQVDLGGTNGVIHIIDSVLIPDLN
ncbi:MAG: fasciclin domain-containing protein [Bacteroidetes bacterium]|nr:fasciclin domain-containing protein [Bacteroidota bacterium]MCH8524641.1 fasciclin domain-containing protein [Balneolales bacterium]